MEFFGLQNAIRDYCTANDIILIYGAKNMSNALMGRHADELTSGKLVLLSAFSSTPNMVNSVVTSVSYSGFYSLGRHCEDTTSSSLDETPEQKYDRRIKDLTLSLVTLIGNIQCANDLGVNQFTIREVLNQFDENLDFVETELTYTQNV